jgi:hypothetical protein
MHDASSSKHDPKVRSIGLSLVPHSRHNVLLGFAIFEQRLTNSGILRCAVSIGIRIILPPRVARGILLAFTMI